jgi:hypothetical protein
MSYLSLLKLDVRAKGHVLEFVRPFGCCLLPVVCPSITASSADGLPSELSHELFQEAISYLATCSTLSHSEGPSITMNKEPMVFLAGWTIAIPNQRMRSPAEAVIEAG